MSQKRKIIIASVIVVIAILFVVLNPKLLRTFTDSFNNAYNHAQETDTEESKSEDGFTVDVPDVKLEVLPEGSGSYNLHISPDTFVFVPPNGTLEEGKWGGHMDIELSGTTIAMSSAPISTINQKFKAYGEWVNLGYLLEGDYTMKVYLVDTNNQVIAVEGAPGDFFYTLNFNIPPR